MNRTGDIYMNRIALAVKSALGLAMLVPPAFASPQRPMTTHSGRNRGHRHPQVRGRIAHEEARLL
jgi:hypothetical protein